MPGKIIDLSTYRFQHGEQLLLDTNVWLVWHPYPTMKMTDFKRKYSETIKKAIQNKAKICLDVFVISEYLNRYCRDEWKAHNLSPGDIERFDNYKEFCKSPLFPPIAEKAAFYVSQMITQCQRVDFLFSRLNLPQLSELLSGFSRGEYDFNDAILAKTCIDNECSFITDDKDFGCMRDNLTILTHNQKLLHLATNETS